MDSSARSQLDSIKYELDAVIREIYSISDGIRGDFKGIGNEICADALRNIAGDYNRVKNKLNNINTSVITESFARAHGIEIY